MILSFHPCFDADVQIILADKPVDEGHIRLIKQAHAIILPQACSFELYKLCSHHCDHVFPNYDIRFSYPGKVGQSRLFQDLGLPHPFTKCWKNVDEMLDVIQKTGKFPHDLPFVIKANLIHEGEGTFIIRNSADMATAMEFLKSLETSGYQSFVSQEFIDSGGRILRVVIIGDQFITYWKAGPLSSHGVISISKGAQIIRGWADHLQAMARDLAKIFQQKSKANLAAIDFIFARKGDGQRPLFLEINYYFGRRGLGGSLRFYEILFQAVIQWLKQTGLNWKRVRLV